MVFHRLFSNGQALINGFDKFDEFTSERGQYPEFFKSNATGDVMTIKIDNQEPNIFPYVEGIDVKDAGRTAEVILATKVDGQLVTMTIRLSYAQAATLAALLEPFRKGE